MAVTIDEPGRARTAARLLTVVIIFLSPTGSRADPKLIDRFNSEARTSWMKYRDLTLSLQGTVSSKTFVDGVPHSDFVYVHKVRRNARSLTETIRDLRSPEETAPEITVHCLNSKYMFTLFGQGKNRYVLSRLTTFAEGPADGVDPVTKEAMLIGGIDVLVRDGIIGLDELLEDPAFKVTGAEAVGEGGNLVEVTFVYPHPVRVVDDRFIPCQAGVLILDPANYWCVRSARFDNQYADGGSGREEVNVILADTQLPYPVPARVSSREVQTLKDGRQQIYAYETTFDLKEPASLPQEEEFTLTAYGLPEPVGVTWERPTPWWVYLLCAAGACVAVGLLLRFAAARPGSAGSAKGESRHGG